MPEPRRRAAAATDLADSRASKVSCFAWVRAGSGSADATESSLAGWSCLDLAGSVRIWRGFRDDYKDSLRSCSSSLMGHLARRRCGSVTWVGIVVLHLLCLLGDGNARSLSSLLV